MRVHRPVVAAALAIGMLGLSAGAEAQQRLLNVSYDPTRELYQDFNTAFAKHWKDTSAGMPVEAALSHEAFDHRPLAPGMRVGVRFRRGRLFPVNAALPSVATTSEPDNIGYSAEFSSSSPRSAAMVQ